MGVSSVLCPLSVLLIYQFKSPTYVFVITMHRNFDVSYVRSFIIQYEIEA